MNEEDVLVFDKEEARSILNELTDELYSIAKERDLKIGSDEISEAALHVVYELDYYDALGLVVLSEIAEYPADEDCAWGMINGAALSIVLKQTEKRLAEDEKKAI